MKVAGDLRILPFELGDLDGVMAIEPRVFSIPWSRQSYEELLRLDTVVVRVAKRGTKLVGYTLFQWWGDELELHTIGVEPEEQRLGIGSRLMDDLIAYAREQRVARIFLLVRSSNTAAKALYERYHFDTIATRPHYYQDNHEDALVMRRDVCPFIDNEAEIS
ncbi:MAG: ribosomal protein S18-alanine N-acetyltransferase [Deltaproteobacteria bacterium]|nr:ribosomal protein S18-alanine N-acetyltransferase [Deltaproteobacteria bacterium]